MPPTADHVPFATIIDVAAAAPPAQQRTIDSWLAGSSRGSLPARRVIIFAQGLFGELRVAEPVRLERFVACPCCGGDVVLRVTLTRALRQHRPHATLLLLPDPRHVGHVRQWLAASGHRSNVGATQESGVADAVD